MIKHLLFIGSIFLLFSCSSGKQALSVVDEDSNADSTEYELVVFEPGFDNWFETNRKPLWYYSHNYYKQWNSLYVREWNSRVNEPGSEQPFDNLIDYNFEVDYGKEIDFELFWYFIFIEDKYNLKLSSSRR